MATARQPGGPTLIHGVVSDSSGRLLAGARVSFVSGPVALPDIAALTDAGGAFTLSAPAPGEYVVSCRADGYAQRSQRVTVRGSERLELDCRLDR